MFSSILGVPDMAISTTAAANTAVTTGGYEGSFNFGDVLQGLPNLSSLLLAAIAVLVSLMPLRVSRDRRERGVARFLTALLVTIVTATFVILYGLGAGWRLSISWQALAQIVFVAVFVILYAVFLKSRKWAKEAVDDAKRAADAADKDADAKITSAQMRVTQVEQAAAAKIQEVQKEAQELGNSRDALAAECSALRAERAAKEAEEQAQLQQVKKIEETWTAEAVVRNIVFILNRITFDDDKLFMYWTIYSLSFRPCRVMINGGRLGFHPLEVYSTDLFDIPIRATKSFMFDGNLAFGEPLRRTYQVTMPLSDAHKREIGSKCDKGREALMASVELSYAVDVDGEIAECDLVPIYHPLRAPAFLRKAQ